MNHLKNQVQHQWGIWPQMDCTSFFVVQHQVRIVYVKPYLIVWQIANLYDRMSHDDDFCITGLYEWNPSVTNEVISVFFAVSVNRFLRKRLSWQWFETSWCSCDVTVMSGRCHFDMNVSDAAGGQWLTIARVWYGLTELREEALYSS